MYIRTWGLTERIIEEGSEVQTCLAKWVIVLLTQEGRTSGILVLRGLMCF